MATSSRGDGGKSGRERWYFKCYWLCCCWDSNIATNSTSTVDLNGKGHDRQDEVGDKALCDEKLPEIVEQYKKELSATTCIFCNGIVPSSRDDESERLQELESMSVKQLRHELLRSDVDISWCLEKRDLVQGQNLASAVCSQSDCRELLKLSCTRTLDCGHRCRGVRAEITCLPCLEDGCHSNKGADQKVFTSGDNMCPICMDPVNRAPAVLLTCGHVVHAHCAKRKIDAGFPGPEISFTFLECALCSQVMQHPYLQPHAIKHEKMRELVKQKLEERLKFEQSNEQQPKSKVTKLAVEPKVEVTEELVIAALKEYLYYVCFKCKEPYFGGIRNCGARNEREAGVHSRELMCGSCFAAANGEGSCTVKGHGSAYLQYKCRFCCSLATYVCEYGTRHTCSSHTDAQPWLPRPCGGPQYCGLGIEHAPNGQEFCLGCSLCRSRGQ